MNDYSRYQRGFRGDEAIGRSGGHAWLNDQAAETLYLSSITLAELPCGIANLPAGRRRERLVDTLDGLLELFGSRILPFDISAARRYAEIAARMTGRGFPVADGFMVATWDTGPFEAAGLGVIPP